jgi:uncharacterized membrane protein SpoIIM required for sporulation
MILDLDRFVRDGEPQWQALDALLSRLEKHPDSIVSLPDLERLHALYQRATADLLRVRSLHAEARLRLYLENLVARAYSAIHGVTERAKPTLLAWLLQAFPRAVRRHSRALALAMALFWGGAILGAALLALLYEDRATLFPFAGLEMKPSERVARETVERSKQVAASTSRFSAHLIQNNTRVAIFTFALGMTYGLGPTVLLFSNGVYLGAVAMDYIKDGQTIFLLGWLLPHGVIELPAIILAGQAAFLLTGALLPRGRRAPLSERLRAIFPDALAIMAGVAVMLLWAGIVEAFFSQYHEPVVPYAVKIAFGLAELLALTLFLQRAGRHVA